MDSKQYYENYNWERANLSKKLKTKIKNIYNIIPKDISSVLDIGCGDGIISNSFGEKYFTVALDRSINALKYVRVNKSVASADYLPIKSNSFDLVFSSEMIEHLPDEIFNKAVEEFRRVSKKYIFLSFPNDENIDKLKTQCISCKFVFNKSYHLRTLNSNIIRQLFPEYKVITEYEEGKAIRHYNTSLSNIKHKLAPPQSWIPDYWTKSDEAIRNTMCPNCGHSFKIPYKFNLISSICDMINVVISPKRPYQLCMLLEKK